MRDELKPSPDPQPADSWWKPAIDAILDALGNDARKRNDAAISFREGRDAPDPARVEATLRRARAE